MTLIFFGLMIAVTLIFFALFKIAIYTDDSIDEKLIVASLIYAGASIEGLI